MTTDLIEAIKGTFIATLAKLFTPVAHADTVLQVPPVWVRASGAEALCGVKRDFLNGLVAQKKITAKKADKIVLYKFADIINAIDSMPEFRK